MTIYDDYHTCHFCGTSVDKEGYEYNGDRHWLSDCRPDLVEHKIGDTCTWAVRMKPLTKVDGSTIPALPIEQTCYAYQDDSQPGRPWTTEHTHFYKDGPM